MRGGQRLGLATRWDALSLSDEHLGRDDKHPAMRGKRARALAPRIAAGSCPGYSPQPAHRTSERRNKPTPASEICGFRIGALNAGGARLIHENALLGVSVPMTWRAGDGTRPAGGETGVSADFGPETSRRVESGARHGPAARRSRARARRKAGRRGRP